MFKRNCSVLLVDDEAFSRTLIGDFLSKMPNIRLAASLANGFSAKEYLLEHMVDVVITDIKMPLMDGLELAAFVKEFQPGCPVVIISAYGEFEYARKAISFGVTDYLLKPVQLEQIEEMIHKACERVENDRNQLLLRKVNPDQELEDKIRKLFQRNHISDKWKTKLSKRMTTRNVVVRLSVDDAFETNGEEKSLIFKQILHEKLHGWHILRTRCELGKYEYLCSMVNKENHRLIGSLGEYLNVTMEQPVEFMVLGEVETVEELEQFYLQSQQNDRPKEIEKALCYMEKHLDQDISRDEVAAHVHLSGSYFSRLFKSEMGVGFGEYLLKMRMDTARKLLAKDKKVREVAEAVGFRDVKYFSVVFYKKVGCLPSDYRRDFLRDESLGDEDV